jgi:hypothetical protein
VNPQYDGLNISQGMGDGEAQVFDHRGHKPLDDLITRWDRKKREEGVKERQQHKDTSDLWKKLNDIEISDFVYDNKYLTDKKNGLQEYVTEQLVKNNGKYEHATDPELIKKLNELEKYNTHAKAVKDIWKTEYAKIQEKKDAWDEGSVNEVMEFFQLPIEERYNRINIERKEVPILKPKVQTYDLLVWGRGIKPKANPNKIETDKEDHYETVYFEQEDKQARETVLNDSWERAKNQTSPQAAQLYKEVVGKLKEDPAYDIASDQRRAEMEEAMFKAKLTEYMDSEGGKKYEKTIQGKPGGKEKREYGNGWVKVGPWSFGIDEASASLFGDINPAGLKEKKKIIRIQRTDAPENISHSFKVDEGRKDIIPYEVEYNEATGKYYFIGEEVVEEPGDGFSKPVKSKKPVRIPFESVKGELNSMVADNVKEIVDELLSGEKKVSTSKTQTKKETKFKGVPQGGF